MKITISNEEKCLFEGYLSDSEVNDLIKRANSFYFKLQDETASSERVNGRIMSKVELEAIHKVCDYFFIKNINRLKGKSRFAEVVQARSIIFYHLVKHYKYTTSRAGEVFSRDHSTVLHSIKLVEGKWLSHYKKIFIEDDSNRRDGQRFFFNLVNETILKVCEYYEVSQPAIKQKLIRLPKVQEARDMIYLHILRESQFSFLKVSEIFSEDLGALYAAAKRAEKLKKDYAKIFLTKDS